MDIPPEWAVSPMDDFATATPQTRGEFNVELYAQLRNTGRILDNFRLGLDGAIPLEVSVDLASVIPAVGFDGWRLTQQFWARDVVIRKNMVTSAWVSVTDSVACQDCTSPTPTQKWLVRRIPIGLQTSMQPNKLRPSRRLPGIQEVFRTDHKGQNFRCLVQFRSPVLEATGRQKKFHPSGTGRSFEESKTLPPTAPIIDG
jgi:hypothetical protein